MTLKEYLEDYASTQTRTVGEELIKKELQTLKNDKMAELVKQNLEKISQGERDFRF